jgi:hypothetical protein
MFRKLILAVTAAAALGATALAPTSASAWGFHGGFHGGGFHGGWYGPRVVIGGPVYDSCMVRTWVQTPGGPALRWVNRCY